MNSTGQKPLCKGNGNGLSAVVPLAPQQIDTVLNAVVPQSSNTVNKDPVWFQTICFLSFAFFAKKNKSEKKIKQANTQYRV